MGIITNEGQEALMQFIADGIDDNSTLRLFIDDITPDVDTELDDLTEASFDGYEGIDLSLQWSSPTLNGEDKWETSTDEQAFTCTGGSPQTVYGYYIDTDETSLIAIKLFDSPIVMENNGDEINVTPRLTINEE